MLLKIQWPQPSHIFHDEVLPVADVGGCLFRSPPPRIRKTSGDQSSLGTAHLLAGFPIISLGSSLGTVDAIAHFNDVQVNLQDALLTPQQLDEHCKISFKSFTDP